MLTTRLAARRPAAPAGSRAGDVLRRRLGRAVVGGGALALLAGCSFFGGGDGTTSVSVFELAPGDCVLSPSDVQAELTELQAVDCEVEHHMEVYARVDFPAAADDGDPQFPGDAATKAFADGACAEEFAAYVGVDYRDAPAHIFFTYLVPSARSWSEGSDRTVTCFVTTTGAPLTGSVAGSMS